MRSAVELHLASCSACREELHVLEDVGSAFADFNVGEPPAQYFADYGAKVRARMQRTQPGLATGAYTLRPAGAAASEKRANWWRYATVFSVSAMAATFVMMFAAVKFVKKGPGPKVDAPGIATIIRNKALPKMLVMPGVQRASLGSPAPVEYVHDPLAPDLAQTLQKDEQRYGYFVFGEKTVGDDKPLFGAMLKTTRDVDRVVGDSIGLMVYDVVPGSPAERMGLRRNDIIVDVNGAPIENGGAKDAVKFLLSLRESGANSPITLQIVRPTRGENLYMLKRGTLGEYGDPSASGVDNSLPASAQF
jgi:hypothetical protein